MANETKLILQEASRITKKTSGIDPTKPGNTRQVLLDDVAFDTYVASLSESLTSDQDKEDFKILAENTRINILENSMFQLNPYETLILPVLRNYYPRLIAKELVTVSPMDKPECVKPFLTSTFAPANSTTYSNAPVTATDISQGVGIGTPVAAAVPVPSNAYDVLNVASLTSTQAHLERDFTIVSVSSDGTNYTAVSIVPAVEGHFSASVTVGGNDDVISGKVDYLNGTITISSATGVVTYARFEVTTCLEENLINPKMKLSIDKIRLYAKDREISSEWSIHMEQDMRALFDLSIQAEIVNTMGQQIALDIDQELINALITANNRLNASTHIRTFANTAPAGYTWGPKYWHENIITELNALSGQIYTDTNIDAPNIIAANPIDVAILEDINTFNYTGTSTKDGDLGYRSATVAGGKWRILTSNVVPQGTMLTVIKSPEDLKSIYIYAPYVPAVLSPYPLGAKPSMTILSRYATALIRSNGIGYVTITA